MFDKRSLQRFGERNTKVDFPDFQCTIFLNLLIDLGIPVSCTLRDWIQTGLKTLQLLDWCD